MPWTDNRHKPRSAARSSHPRSARCRRTCRRLFCQNGSVVTSARRRSGATSRQSSACVSAKHTRLRPSATGCTIEGESDSFARRSRRLERTPILRSAREAGQPERARARAQSAYDPRQKSRAYQGRPRDGQRGGRRRAARRLRSGVPRRSAGLRAKREADPCAPRRAVNEPDASPRPVEVRGRPGVASVTGCELPDTDPASLSRVLQRAPTRPHVGGRLFRRSPDPPEKNFVRCRSVPPPFDLWLTAPPRPSEPRDEKATS